MKLRLAIYQWKKHLILSIFITLQLAAVFILTISSCSVLKNQTHYYNIFSDYFRSDGIFLELFGMNLDNNTSCQNSKDLEGKLHNADVLSCYTLYASLQEKGFSSVMFRAYDPEIIKRHTPEMKNGKWLSSRATDGKVLHVAVAGLDVQVGNTLHAVTLDNEIIPMEVIGIVDNHATIVGHTNGERGKQTDYMQMYTDMSTVKVDGCTILLNQQEVLAAQKIYKTLSCAMSDIVLIKYDKDISEQDRNYNWEFIKENASVNYKVYMQDLNKTSLRNIRPKLLFLIPILIAVFLLTLISSVCNNAIILREQLYDYAVFNLCGMRWKNCIIINLYSILLNVVLGGCITGILFKINIQGKKFLDTSIQFNGLELICIIGIVLLYVLLSMIQPYLLFHQQSTKTILNNQHHMI